MRKLWIAAEDVWVSNFDSQEQNFRKSEQSGGRRVLGSFLSAEVWSLTFHDPQLCNVQYIQPDLKYFYSGLWNSTEQKKWNQCHMKCVGNNTKYITKYNHNIQFSTKVITIRIDFNLYFDNIRHICVSIYIHEGLIYSTQRLDERTQSYMRPNVV